VTSIVSATSDRPAVRLVSPVLVVMLLISAYGAWSLWQDNAGIAVGLGVPAIAGVLMWIVYGVIGVGIVVALQSFASRPLWGIVVALLWGGFAATWAAGAANAAMSTIFMRTIGENPAPYVSTPLIEESMKALGVIGLVLIPVMRRVRVLDGLFYGVLVGAGFQVVEDAVYTLVNLFHSSGDMGMTVIGTLFVRGFTIGLFTHAVFTGIIGAGIGWVASAPAGDRRRRVTGAVLAAALVMLAHGIFNRDLGLEVEVAMSLIPMVVLVAIIWLARRAEVQALAGAAAATGGWGMLGDADIALLTAPRSRSKAERRRQHLVRSVAWAADHLGTESRATAKAAARLARLGSEG